MMIKLKSISIVLFCVSIALGVEVIDDNLVIANVDRSIDLSSQIVKVALKMTLLNNGNKPVSHFHHTVESGIKDHVSFITCSLSNGKSPLQVVEVKQKAENDNHQWRINLREDLLPGKKINIEIETFLTRILTPFPSTILQKEKQLILYDGNAYLFSPYTIKKQTTAINIGTKNIESFTKFKPAAQSDMVIKYGPYENVGPFSEEKIAIHYENNSPFLTVTNLERVLEVSHWGNVAVEETISLENKGALLKGSFSRYDYQRDAQSGLSSVKSFKTILPASVKDVYYRDDIGNISTSNLRLLSDSTEIDLRPRFPIFGGWKTKYTIGYNLPSYEYLFNSGEKFLLKMRILDHVYDDMVVENLRTKIILPEGVKNIQLKTAFPVKRLPNEKHFTYLDTIGRSVVVLESNNLVESHIQDFQLSYTFPKIFMLQEPLLAVFAFFTLFLIGIIYLRLDFSISSSSAAKKLN